MTIPSNICDREYQKFGESTDGKTAVRTLTEGSFSTSGLSTALKVTNTTVGTIATKLPLLPLTARNSMIDTVTILLGITVGASTQADVFLTSESILIFVLGAFSFMIATAGGLLFAKFMNLFLSEGNKVNPLIGNAGVSAVPMSSRISQNVGLEYDSSNYLLMHAMGPNVAGVIGSAVSAGVLLGFLM